MSEDEQPGSAAPRRPSRWRRRFAWGVGGFVALLLALSLGIPSAIGRWGWPLRLAAGAGLSSESQAF